LSGDVTVNGFPKLGSLDLWTSGPGSLDFWTGISGPLDRDLWTSGPGSLDLCC